MSSITASTKVMFALLIGDCLLLFRIQVPGVSGKNSNHLYCDLRLLNRLLAFRP
jgi:hypothetical protein